MKKSHLPLAIILTVLLTVILIASVVLVIALSNSAPQNGPDDGTTTPNAGVTTTAKSDDGTPGTTTPPAPAVTTPNTPDTDSPVTTTKPSEPPTTPTTTTKPADTTKPAGTTEPVVTPTPSPGLNEVSGTVKGDSIDSLGIFARYVTEEIDEDARTIKLRFTFYLQSYGLRIGARGDNYLTVNGKEYKGLLSDKIDLPNGSPLTQTELYEYEVEIEKPDDNTPVSLELEYFWHFQGTYAGEYSDWLSVKVDLTL